MMLRPGTLPRLAQHLARLGLTADITVHGAHVTIRTDDMTACYDASELAQLVIEAPLWCAGQTVAEILW